MQFDPDSGVRILQPDNWIILAELPEDELAAVVSYHGLVDGEHTIVAHTPADPADPGHVPQVVEVTADDVVAAVVIPEAQP